MFVIFVSNITSGIKYTLIKFAEDTKLCGTVYTLEENYAIQRDLDRLKRWICEKLMKLKKDKYKVLYLD